MSASFDSNSVANVLTKTISITSGKGGVGKSTLVTNLSLALAQKNKKILILDGDLGLANVDIMFGVRSTGSVEQVLSGSRGIDEIIIDVAENISLIPGGSGIYGLQNTSLIQKKMLLDQISQLPTPYDYMLIDTASGIDDNVLYLNSAAHEVVVVLTPDPSSLADAYALIKVMNKKYQERKFSIVANLCNDEKEGLALFKRLSDVSQKFLNVSLDYKGFIPADADLRKATKSQQLILREMPNASSAQAIRKLAEKLSVFNGVSNLKGGMQFFWEQLAGVAS
ncbi:MAG: MinD/ParA family protein [Bdellovibrionota bacterium]